MKTNWLSSAFLSFMVFFMSIGVTYTFGVNRNQVFKFRGSGLMAQHLSQLYPKPRPQVLKKLKMKNGLSSLNDEEFDALIATSGKQVGDFVADHSLVDILHDKNLKRELISIMQHLSPEDRYKLRTALLKRHKDAVKEAVRENNERLNNVRTINQSYLSDSFYRSIVKNKEHETQHENERLAQQSRQFSTELDRVIESF